MKQIRLSGIMISLLSRTELAQRIDAMLAGNHAHQIATINAEYIVEAYRNSAFRTVLAASDLATADGSGIIFACYLQGIRPRLSERITGVALTEELLARAERDHHPVTILLKENSLTTPELLLQKLHASYPLLQVTVFREPVSTETIANSSPQILFTALGSPAQDFWIHDRLHLLPGLKLGIGVGGTFDFISGTIQRAPKFLRMLGLEWLWRLNLEPKRLPRILRAIIVFPFLVLTKK